MVWLGVIVGVVGFALIVLLALLEKEQPDSTFAECMTALGRIVSKAKRGDS